MSGALAVGLIAAAAVVFTSPAQGAVTAAPKPAKGSDIARVLVPTKATASPGKGRALLALKPSGGFTGSPTQLAVVGRRVVAGKEYLQVLLPKRPNGSRGWVSADNVRVHRTPWKVVVDVSSRTLTVLHNGKARKKSKVVVGKPSTPTPYGTFAIRESVAQPGSGGFYGPYVLTLTAFSNVLERFAGGPGLVAIHGRGGGSLRDPLGSASSHGCVRVPNDLVAWMNRNLEAGVPVQIRA